MRTHYPVKISRIGLHTAFAALCVSIITVVAGAARPGRLLVDFHQSVAIIETSRHECRMLNLYLTETPQQRAQGLMFVEQMDEAEGMLFTYPQPALMTMWMKNTYIPLDMLFIHPDGTISSITKKTTPLSTKRISSTEPVTMVLELNGGLTDRWGIEPGNRLLTVN